MKTYLIAEVGSTHDGSLGNALRMVEVFAKLGASAIKLQDHRMQHMRRSDVHPAWFNGTPYETRLEYVRRLDWEQRQWERVMLACKVFEVDLIVSPFGVMAAKMNAGLVDAYKVASGQVTNLELLHELVRIGKPVHLSSGMTTLSETFEALRILKPVLRSVMACTSEYPCPPEHWPIDAMCCPMIFTGLSDHSGGIIAPLLAIWEGAEVLEVHVTLSRAMYGSDAAHSLEPAQFAELVRGIKQVEAARDSTVTREERVALLADTRKAFLHNDPASLQIASQRAEMEDQASEFGAGVRCAYFLTTGLRALHGA